MCMINIVDVLMCLRYVTKAGRRYTMSRIQIEDTMFHHQKHDLYETDVKLHLMNRLSGSNEVAKPYV